MNLFHKYVGAGFWSDFLNVFYTRIASSAILEGYFVEKDIEHIKSMLIGLLEITLVSNDSYNKDELKAKHIPLNIKESDFDE